ncbi:coiled-coil domain-containing protein 97 [Sabethes cyaneus]|uniref:coiled-coil domain-containing protein 97 n=1 Tax=Sabethes cyaneus TaxID=53552 RepID=UPI00237E39C4|nr:coiled-coil domain-containing protein 97 [Sabethes cyaneus]
MHFTEKLERVNEQKEPSPSIYDETTQHPDETGESNMGLVTEADLVEYISRDQKVFYKSQQINDPELTVEEKLNILKEVLSKSHTTFLSRFGHFIKEDHLRYFEQDQETCGYSPDERYEVEYYLEKIRRSHNGGREREIRNRRYAALKQLVQDGSYFSEMEMMQREPLLYEQLVGQYLTEQERKARDAEGSKKDSLVSILFNGIDKDNTDALRKEQQSEETRMEQVAAGCEDEDDSEDSGRENRPETPAFSRAQWGNFDVEEEERLKNIQLERDAEKRNKKYSVPVSMVTAGERDLLRDEFIGTMYSKFISGEDGEFDYSKIDESAEYENLDIIEQDEQERYFDSEDTEGSVPPNDTVHSDMQLDDNEEDDLDIYMRHIDQHLKNQQNMERMNSQMRDINCEYESDD